MHQKWNHLLFLHWPIDPQIIQDLLHKPLTVATHNNQGYLSIVAFTMSHIRPKFINYPLNLVSLNELNLRTYVTGPDQGKGVYFFTLESNHTLGNFIANTFFKLPYRYSKLNYSTDNNNFHFFGHKNNTHHFDFNFTPSSSIRLAKDDPTENFLYENYHFYTVTPNASVYKGTIAHDLYPVQDIQLNNYTTDLFKLYNFDEPASPPSVATYTHSLDIQVKNFKKL